jgi:hypothetical protein
LADGGLTPKFLEERVADYIADRQLAKLPKAIVEQQASEEQEAQETADEV